VVDTGRGQCLTPPPGISFGSTRVVFSDSRPWRRCTRCLLHGATASQRCSSLGPVGQIREVGGRGRYREGPVSAPLSGISFGLTLRVEHRRGEIHIRHTGRGGGCSHVCRGVANDRIRLNVYTGVVFSGSRRLTRQVQGVASSYRRRRAACTAGAESV